VYYYAHYCMICMVCKYRTQEFVIVWTRLNHRNETQPARIQSRSSSVRVSTAATVKDGEGSDALETPVPLFAHASSAGHASNNLRLRFALPSCEPYSSTGHQLPVTLRRRMVERLPGLDPRRRGHGRVADP